MKFISQLLAAHLERYPRMQLTDIYKLLHQAAMGPGHAVDDEASARRSLQQEAEQLGAGVDDPLADPISPDGKLARVHLRAYIRAGYDLESLANAFIATARKHQPASDKLIKFCGCLGDLAAAGGIPFARAEVEREFDAIAAQGYPVMRHSAVYRELYSPAYRVVAIEFLPALSKA
jgi:hypothetical protein